MAEPSKVGIIGAGLSGLSTAYYLKRVGQSLGIELEITLLEKSNRVGGVIQTEKVDGFLLEAGPEGWASYKRAAKDLIADLELTPELIGSKDEHRKTFIAQESSLDPIPDGMTFLSPVEPVAFWRTAKISRLGKVRAFLEPFVPSTEGDLSARDFFTQRLGAEFAERLIEPFVGAIFGADFTKLSVASAMPELYRAEQRAGSLWKGLRPLAKLSLSNSVLFSLERGMSRLTERLEEKVSDVTIIRGLSDLDLTRAYNLTVLKGTDFEEGFDHIVLSTPAHETAKLLESCCLPLRKLLVDIPYTSSTLVYLAYRKHEFSHPLDGFGFIVPAHEAEVLDACTWVNRKFEGRCPSDFVLLRAAIHNGRRERPELSESDTVERVHREIKRFMGISAAPVFHKVFQVRNAIPQLLVGHVRRTSRIRSALTTCPGIHLAASYFGGVGVPDCIQTAKDVAHAVLAQIDGEG